MIYNTELTSNALRALLVATWLTVVRQRQVVGAWVGRFSEGFEH